MDITIPVTLVILAAILLATWSWNEYRKAQPDKAAILDELARRAVMLAQDKKLSGILPSGDEALNFATEWLMEAANKQGYTVNVVEAMDMARIAYVMIFKSGK